MIMISQHALVVLVVAALFMGLAGGAIIMAMAASAKSQSSSDE